MARLYQNTLGDPQRVIVKAAHMEIASPTIPDVLNEFAELGVDEIVCHPYFLSPGRHVKEDIPRIVEDAIENLGLDIPVITTSPVGSHTELMINAIHSLVEESSAILSQYTAKGKVGPGGN
jgi:sirohydrochlorin ferrochelatase